MNDIPPIQSSGQVASTVSPRSTAAKPTSPEYETGDQLEISETGQILSSLSADPSIRADRVAQIRQAIADGTYETQDKLDVTIDRLMDVLRTTDVTA
jgi:negative regulator of flagellin synthesis FlgM